LPRSHRVNVVHKIGTETMSFENHGDQNRLRFPGGTISKKIVNSRGMRNIINPIFFIFKKKTHVLTLTHRFFVKIFTLWIKVFFSVRLFDLSRHGLGSSLMN